MGQPGQKRLPAHSDLHRRSSDILPGEISFAIARKMIIKAKIFSTPANKHRSIFKERKPLLYIIQCCVGIIFFRKRNILNEPQCGYSVIP